MSDPKTVTPVVVTPTLSTAVKEDSVAYQNIPLLLNSPVVQINTNTKDSIDGKTKLYVQTQVYNRFQHSVNNAKNLFGTVLAASVLVWGVVKLARADEEVVDNIEYIGKASAIAFSTAHLLNAVVANATSKDDDAKYKPNEIPNPYLSKN